MTKWKSDNNPNGNQQCAEVDLTAPSLLDPAKESLSGKYTQLHYGFGSFIYPLGQMA